MRLTEHQALDCYLHTKADPTTKPLRGRPARGVPAEHRAALFGPFTLFFFVRSREGGEGFELHRAPDGPAALVWTLPGHVHAFRLTRVRSLAADSMLLNNSVAEQSTGKSGSVVFW